MAKHIGVVACSAEGAALCYRTICIEGADFLGKHAHPEVTMHTYPLNEYMRFIERGDWDGVAMLMASSAEKVAKAGADFLICPDNTVHQAFDRLVKITTLPWLHIAEEVAAEANQRKYKSLGVLGTLFLMEGPVYAEKLAALGIDYIIPEEDECERINHIIFNELVNSLFTDESRTYFRKIISHLKQRGCDAVVLGCTEIPLLITQEDSPLPLLDSTRLLARAALKKAVS